MTNTIGYDAALQRFHICTQYHPNKRTHRFSALHVCYVLVCELIQPTRKNTVYHDHCCLNPEVKHA